MIGANGSHKDAADRFHNGTDTHAYEYLGAHREGERFLFRVWAPRAKAVWVSGDFCEWNPAAIPMKRVTDGGVWEASVDARAIRAGQTYKYRILGDGGEVYKADPFGTAMQKPPETASVIADTEGYRWRDAGWLGYRKQHFTRERIGAEPINVYEVHLGSWARGEQGELLRYPALARELATYAKQMGYTHVELLPVCEYPYDPSLGYQSCGFFAPTARYGTAEEFMSFVDVLHEAGIGVILDWTAGIFPKDAHGLFAFDGQPLYEYGKADRIEETACGECLFDLGKHEVRSFLASNAVYWIERYHIDGLRLAAVDAMLCADGERARDFLCSLNAMLARDYPDVITVGNRDAGLGFTLQKSNGWTEESMRYLETDPLWRRYEHGRLHAALQNASQKGSLLAVSHDEGGSLVGRMHGDVRQKLASARLFLTYMMTHPGKKLLFMGGELGMLHAWEHTRALDWSLTDREPHARFQYFCAELNHLYLEQSPLWERDGEEDGFAWIDSENADLSICSYRRIDAAGRELLILLNFTPVLRRDFLLEVGAEGVYEELLNSDAKKYGGDGVENVGALKTVSLSAQDGRSAVCIQLPPLSAIVLRKRDD